MTLACYSFVKLPLLADPKRAFFWICDGWYSENARHMHNTQVATLVGLQGGVSAPSLDHES